MLVAVDGGAARAGAALRGLARRRAVPASLRAARPLGGRLGRAAAARRRRPPPLSPTCRHERLRPAARPFLFALDPGTGPRPGDRARSQRGLVPHPRSRRIRVCGGSSSASISRTRSAWPPASTRTARCPTRCSALGFGFVEVGTVTPRPQPAIRGRGSSASEHDGRVINRLGFNNDGHDAVARAAGGAARGAASSASISAPTSDSADRIADYAAGVARFADVADYLVDQRLLAEHAGAARPPGACRAGNAARRGDRRARAGARSAVPLLLKIAPDLDDDGARGDRRDGARRRRRRHDRRQHDDRAATALQRPRAAPPRPAACPAGRSSAARRRCWPSSAGSRAARLVLVGAGGVDSAETAFAKIRAGRGSGPALHRPGLPRSRHCRADPRRPRPHPRRARLRLDRRCGRLARPKKLPRAQTSPPTPS